MEKFKFESPKNLTESGYSSTEKFKSEILPIIEILKPEGVSLSEYEQKVTKELFESVKKMQTERGVLFDNPDNTIEEAKNLLNSQIKEVLKDARNYSLKRKLDEGFVKKAKIALLFQGDMTDASNSSYLANNAIPKIQDLNTYINGWGDYGENRKWTEEDIDSLMKTKYRKSLTNVTNDHMYYIGTYGTLNKIPKSLMIGLVQAEEENPQYNHYWVIKSGLEVAEKGKYDNECLEQLLAASYTKPVLENIDKFQNNPLEKVLKSGIPNGREAVNLLLRLNLTKEEFEKYFDTIIRHNIGDEIVRRMGGSSDEVLESVILKYEETLNKLYEINKDSSENNPEDLEVIKDIINKGQVGIVSGVYKPRKYIKIYAETDYENFLKNINSFDQEHLVTEYLKEEDMVKYAHKLLKQGEGYQIPNLYKTLSHSFDKHSLDFDIFSELKKLNFIPCFKGDLSLFKNIPQEEVLELIANDRVNLFINNINSFDVSSEFLNRKEIQDACFAEFIKNLNDFHVSKSKEISNKIPFPKDLLDRAVLENVKTKWIKNDRRDWARYTIMEFPNIKEFLNNPEDKERALEDLKKELSLGYMSYTADILENFCFDKDSLNSQEIKDLCIESIKRSSRFNYDNQKDFNNTIKIYFDCIERVSKYIEVPEYLKQQKETVNIILSMDMSSFIFYKNKLIYKIIGSENPKEIYDGYIKLSNEIKDKSRLLSVSPLVEKYFSKFEKDDNKEEKNRFISYVENMSDGMFYSGLFVDNFDYLYNNFSQLTGSQLESHKILLDRFVSHLESSLIKDVDFQTLFQRLSSYSTSQQDEFFEIIDMGSSGYLSNVFNENNYTKNIISYVNIKEELELFNIRENLSSSILDNFNGEYKDIALKKINKDWQLFLDSESKYLPPNLYFISKIIDDAGGAGNLKHFESIGNLMHQVDESVDNPKTSERTILEIKNILLNQEKIFEKDKWSQDDRSEFYNLSNDILNAAPSLYSEFGPIFDKMSPKETKDFVKEIFPFYQAQLVIIQEMGEEGFSYNPKKLVEVRSGLKSFSEKMSQNKEENMAILKDEKTRLLDLVKEGFKDRFGLIKSPKEFDKEKLRSIQNGIRYMGNMSNRSLEREAIVSFYLGLELNGEWGSFRQGKDIKVEEYLSGKHLEVIKSLMEERIKNQESLSGIVGIPMNKMPKFQEILQEEVISNIIGNVETVDIKLGNIKRNVLDLTDPDIYENENDKEIIKLLVKDGKFVGSMLAKTYAEASGKSAFMTSEEKELQFRVASIFGIQKWDTMKVKKIQDSIQPLSLVSNMINKMNEEKVEENIEELKKRLIPTKRIIEIFNRLGEDFKQDSGAIALSKDLTYLESLIVKDSNKITKEEKTEVNLYLDKIKEKMKELEITFDKVKEYFEKIKKSSHLDNNSLLKNRLSDIEAIISSRDSSAMIVSHMTKDLNLIIENMRQCLGCMRKEINNDTNLTFGEYNKFFMINQSGKERGSISDEIVFFAPIKKPNGKEEMSFVMDRVYGSRSSDVLVGNILSVYKKYQAIKKEFPNANLSISVSKETMLSVGIDYEILKKRLSDIVKNINKGEFVEDLSVNFFKSKFGDNYVEFGDKGPRESGDRKFSALVLA